MITRSKARQAAQAPQEQKKTESVKPQGQPVLKKEKASGKGSKKTKDRSEEGGKKDVGDDGQEKGWVGRLRDKPHSEKESEPQLEKKKKTESDEVSMEQIDKRRQRTHRTSRREQKRRHKLEDRLNLMEDRLTELRNKKQELLASISREAKLPVDLLFGNLGHRNAVNEGRTKTWLAALEDENSGVVEQINTDLSILLAEGSFSPNCLGDDKLVEALVSKLMTRYQGAPQLSNQTSVCIKNILSINPRAGVQGFLEAGGIQLFLKQLERIEFIDVIQGSLEVIELVAKRYGTQPVLSSPLPEKVFQVMDFFDLHSRARIVRIVVYALQGDLNFTDAKNRFLPLVHQIQNRVTAQEEDVA